MFNINLEEAELELKEVKDEYNIDISDEIKVLESIQLTIGAMVISGASNEVMCGVELLESKIINHIMNEEDEEVDTGETNTEDNTNQQKTPGRFKRGMSAVWRGLATFFNALVKFLHLKKRTREESNIKAKQVLVAYIKEYNKKQPVDEKIIEELKELDSIRSTYNSFVSEAEKTVASFAESISKKATDAANNGTSDAELVNKINNNKKELQNVLAELENNTYKYNVSIINKAFIKSAINKQLDDNKVFTELDDVINKLRQKFKKLKKEL